MDNITNFTNFKINEEFLGGLFNFFKGLWKKMAAEIQKLNDDPNKIKDYIVNNTLNINSPNSIFKKELETIKLNTGTEDADTFKIIDSILNKDTGALGKQGIGMLFNDPSLQGDKMKVKRLTFEYIINTARDQVSKKINYDPSKGKDPNYIKGLKIFTEAQPIAGTAPTGATATPTNSNYSYVKYFKLFETDAVGATAAPPVTGTPAEANEKINEIKKWIGANIVANMVNSVKAIKEDDIKAYVAKGGGVAAGEYKVGDVVRYKMKDFIEGTEPDKQKDKIGNKAIAKIEGDNYIFTDKDGKEFTKTKDQILGKAEGDETEGAEVNDLKTKLATMKDNKEQMSKVLKYANFISDPANKDKPYTETPTEQPA